MRIPVCDLADRKFLAFSKPPAANTMKVNNTSSKISDVGFEWISANLDQISLYVPNFALVGLSIFFFVLGLSIFAKRVPWMNGRKRLDIFAFVFHLFSGFGLTSYMLVYILTLFLYSTIERVVIYFA